MYFNILSVAVELFCRCFLVLMKMLSGPEEILSSDCLKDFDTNSRYYSQIIAKNNKMAQFVLGSSGIILTAATRWNERFQTRLL